MGDPTAHPRYGVEARTEEFGEAPQQGRDDLTGIVDEMKCGAMSLDDVIWMHPELYQRNSRALTALWAIVNKRKAKDFRRVEVHILWGEAGAGKTRQVHEQHGDDLYTVEFDDHKLWWDGYNGESAILMDDFYGQVKYAELLRLWDGYSKRLNVKGSHTYAHWTQIWVTSNRCPCKWYTNLPGGRAWDNQAFRRRITSVTKVGDVPDCEHEQPVVLDHDASV